MNGVNFLVLTDHRGHSDQNSLYALVRKLIADRRTAEVLVASRGDERNTAFFAGDTEKSLVCLRANENFRYDASGELWRAASYQQQFSKADVVWLRLPPPADEAFFASLTLPAPATAPLVINDPAGILETGSKAFLLNFPDFTAPVRRVQGEVELLGFAATHDLVLKPLNAYGGQGIVKIAKGIAEVDGQTMPLEEYLQLARKDLEAGNFLAMKYLRNVDQGDKRILVVNGRILGASLRLPAPGEWLCNVARGGTSVPAEVTPEEEAMVAAISPVLLDKGIVIYGADTLMDDDGKRVLSEINTNSIGGFPQAEAQSGRPVLQQTIDGLYDYCYGRI